MSKEDFIGRDEIISKITELVDIMPVDKNCCIALDGEWGSGKSFVMDRLKENFESKENNFVVFYDAWKNNFYSDPLIAILYCIFDTLQSKVDIKPKRTRKGYKAITIKDCDKEKTKKIVGLVDKAIKENGSKVSNEILNNLKDIGSAGAVLYYAISLIKGIIKQAKATILDNNLFAEFKSYQSLLEETKATLNLITGDKDKPSKLIILVDEIDRCLPNEQLVILERLHHLFDINNCAVIVALNKQIIVDSYNKQYCSIKNLGEEYLYKFFDYEFVLDKDEEYYFLNYLGNLIDNQFIPNKGVGKDCAIKVLAYIKTKYSDKNIRKNKFTARDVSNYMDILLEILKKLSDKIEIFCIHIWFVSVMLFTKLYTKEFIYYRFGFSKNKDFIQINDVIGDKFIDKYSSKQTNADPKTYYFTYSEHVYNIMQYCLNYCLYRKDKEKIEYLKYLSNASCVDMTWIDMVIEMIDIFGDDKIV